MIRKLSAATAIALVLSFGSSRAADLPSIKGPPVYLPPPPVFSWTGFYAGVNIGYGFGNNDPDYGAHSFYTPFRRSPTAPTVLRAQHGQVTR